ncbi:MAG: DUF523 domain-containing protein [Candidatus Hadarchaeota archaeon]
MRVIVSACLLGVNCRYDGGNACSEEAVKYIEENNLIPIPVCPEQLAGLPTPRDQYEVLGDGFDVLEGRGEVRSIHGEILTSQFLRGAEETLKIAKLLKAEVAFLKSLSPSCGAGKIYDGTFSGEIKEGYGITAAILKKNGIEVKEI